MVLRDDAVDDIDDDDGAHDLVMPHDVDATG
jgi:hypothetical protein